jgi:hypothetical protein
MSSLNDLYDKLGKRMIDIENIIKKTNVKRQDLQTAVLSMNELSQTPYNTTAFTCQDSLFKDVKFRFKPNPIINHPLLHTNKNTPIRFSDLCKLLVEYISINKLFTDKGYINCDHFLKSITGTETATFFTILQNIGKIIV